MKVLKVSEKLIRNFIDYVGGKTDKVCIRLASKLIKSQVAGTDE
ncbi:hypothetical protein EVA_02727 [gut metagenome]|uniref:Uncharacterized protein n=1 Tax=gut metagenome TaxID=749906 RepID=J9GMF5_9ZZZZ